MAADTLTAGQKLKTLVVLAFVGIGLFVVYDFRGFGGDKHTVPKLGQGRHELRFVATWHGSKPEHIIYTVANVNRTVQKNELEGTANGEWIHGPVVYVEGQQYGMQVTNFHDGYYTCTMYIDGTPYCQNERRDAGSIRCFINRG